MEINYSFIIPHRNCPDLLNRCLASIPQREDIQICGTAQSPLSPKWSYHGCYHYKTTCNLENAE